MAWQALAALGAQTAGSIFGSIQQRKNVKDTIKHQRSMAEYEWSKNLDMWNLQNEYNTPEKQMERFKSAGLNPNMIYGQGSSGNATTMPKYNAIRPDYTARPSIAGRALSVLGGYQDFQMKNAQIDQVRENTNYIKAKEATEQLNRGLKMYQRAVMHQKAELGTHQSSYFKEMAKTQFEQLQEDLRNKRLAADIRQKEINFYEWLKITGMIGGLASPLGRFIRR